MVVQSHVTHERLLQILTTGESMGFEHIGNAPIKAFDHAIGSGRAWPGQAMFNVQGLAQLIKLMVARGLALTAGKQSVSELLAVVGQDFLYFDRTSLVQGVQKRASCSGRLVTLDLNEHPARGAVNGHKQIAPAGLVRHLGQVFDIDVNEPRFVAFEGFVRLSWLFGLERVEVANAVAAKTPIKARACGLGAKKFAGDGQQVVQGQEQGLAQFDHDLFLCRCERSLKPVRSVRSVMKGVSAFPLVNGAFTHAVAQRQSGSSLRAGRHLSTGGGRGACVLVQGNHHDKAPGWTAVVTQRLSISCFMTSLAMNNGYRFESMQSSGMRQLPSAVDSNAVCSTEFLPFVPTSLTTTNFVYALLIEPSFMNAMTQLVTGTSNSHQRIKPDSVLSLRQVIPQEHIVKTFDEIVSALLERMKATRQQIQTLSALRDTLLPRLISGQLSCGLE